MLRFDEWIQMPERIGTFTVCQKNPVAADKRANGSMLSPLNGHSRRVAFVRGESGLRSQTLLANTSLLCAAPNIGTSKARVGAAARTGSPRRAPLWGSDSSPWCPRSVHCANRRRDLPVLAIKARFFDLSTLISLRKALADG
jgi:hypothetical protein